MSFAIQRLVSPVRRLPLVSRFENFLFALIETRPRSVSQARKLAQSIDVRNSALKSNEEIAAAYRVLRGLRLRQQYDSPLKVWDGMRFLSFILNHVSLDSPILDLGCGPHSNVLYWLETYGYT